MPTEARAEVLRLEYQQRFEANRAYRDAVWKALCESVFSRLIQPTDTVLDLGAGWGEFSRNIVARRKYAMDLNPDCGQRVEGYAEFLHQDCSERWPLEDESLDVVFTSNFLEHLSGKDLIDLTLDEASRCLRKGGLIVCVGPNVRCLPGAYWDYWDHFTPITDRSMAEALSLHRFDVVRRTPRFLPYTMSEGRNPPLWAVRAYLAMPVFWPVFGRQFFVVGRKTG